MRRPHSKEEVWTEDSEALCSLAEQTVQQDFYYCPMEIWFQSESDREPNMFVNVNGRYFCIGNNHPLHLQRGKCSLDSAAGLLHSCHCSWGS